MNLFLILFLINFPFFLSLPLNGNYPFSVKSGFDEAITFMDDQKISIYSANLAEPNHSTCLTGVEKGGICLDGYYFCDSCNEMRSLALRHHKSKN